MLRFFRRLLLVLTALLALTPIAIAANDVPTQFTNRDSIINTRHNMSQDTLLVNGGNSMNNYRNRYGEVCVYCHVPAAMNSNPATPLWNRALPTALYVTYDRLRTSTLTQNVRQPGPSSLTCLSCHDGQQAVDAIINMPGAAPNTTGIPSPTTWDPVAAGLPANYKSAQHRNMKECMFCHAPDGGPVGLGLGSATDFSAFLIGTDLSGVHPVGVNYPAENGFPTDWKTPTGTVVLTGQSAKFFDENSNGVMDSSEIRLYNSGFGASVECASCHDPHGVPSAGPGSQFNPSFLRKPNQGSGVCLTCHTN